MKIHWYELVYRGVSPGAFPRGSFTTDHDHVNHKGRQFGAVAYLEPLTEEQINSYELEPIAAPRELYDFEKYLLKNK